MNRTFGSLIVVLLLIGLGSTFQNTLYDPVLPRIFVPVHAQNQFTVSTDKFVYNAGETVRIFIQPAPPQLGSSYWLIIRAPDYSEIRINLSAGQTRATVQAGPLEGQYKVELWNQPVVPNPIPLLQASTYFQVGPTQALIGLTTVTSAITIIQITTQPTTIIQPTTIMQTSIQTVTPTTPSAGSPLFLQGDTLGLVIIILLVVIILVLALRKRAPNPTPPKATR